MNPTPPKPPADALPDVKALCERLKSELAVQRLKAATSFHHQLGTTGIVLTDAITALERLAGEAGRQRQIIEVYEGTTRKLAQLETSLRSSEAALALARREAAVDRKRANFHMMAQDDNYDRYQRELTALRANAGDADVVLDWLERVHDLDSRIAPRIIGGKGIWRIYDASNGLVTIGTGPTFRQAIRAAMSSAARNGGEGERK